MKELHDELLLNENQELPNNWWKKEYWKQIPETYNYYISTLGRVYSSKRNHMLKPILESQDDNPKIFIHYNNIDSKKYSKRGLTKLVFETFFFTIPTTYSIIHIDADKSNCALDNLGLVNFYNHTFNHNDVKKRKEK